LQFLFFQTLNGTTTIKAGRDYAASREIPGGSGGGELVVPSDNPAPHNFTCLQPNCGMQTGGSYWSCDTAFEQVATKIGFCIDANRGIDKRNPDRCYRMMYPDSTYSRWVNSS
jgi:hypothetical protein